MLNGLHYLGDLGSNVSTLDQSTINLLDSLLSLARVLKVNETEALGRDSPVIASPEGPDGDLGLLDLNGKVVENGGKSGVIDREGEIGNKDGGLCLMLVFCPAASCDEEHVPRSPLRISAASSLGASWVAWAWQPCSPEKPHQPRHYPPHQS